MKPMILDSRSKATEEKGRALRELLQQKIEWGWCNSCCGEMPDVEFGKCIYCRLADSTTIKRTPTTRKIDYSKYEKVDCQWCDKKGIRNGMTCGNCFGNGWFYKLPNFFYDLHDIEKEREMHGIPPQRGTLDYLIERGTLD